MNDPGFSELGLRLLGDLVAEAEALAGQVMTDGVASKAKTPKR